MRDGAPVDPPAPLPLARPNITDDEVSAVVRVLRSRHIASGPETAELERELSAKFGGRDVVCVSSGGAALLLALMAAGTGPGDEVVVPDFVFPAAAHAALFLGALPVPADVDLETLSITPESVARRLTPSTKAVVVVHPFGIPADVEGIAAICPPSVRVIEDGACALGGLTASGAAVGTVGEVSCFSFHPRKSISTGEGGCVVADGDTARRLRLWHDYGRVGKGYGDIFHDVGLNLRLSDICAAVGRVQLARLQDSIRLRGRIAQVYFEGLERLDFVRVPAGHRLPGNTFQSFVVETKLDPSIVIAGLAEHGIAAGPAAQSLSMQSMFRSRFAGLAASSDGSGPRLAMNTIALPMFDEMTDAQAWRVIEALATVSGQTGLAGNPEG
ncbi:DegT/DnrJ/EryC1/StrS family aminotransferase [Myxococcota bacterium]|nr:DegT/DnrJ/EryC1/StrS family aminotransferase [Myxococcota bacterium]